MKSNTFTKRYNAKSFSAVILKAGWLSNFNQSLSILCVSMNYLKEKKKKFRMLSVCLKLQILVDRPVISVWSYSLPWGACSTKS